MYEKQCTNRTVNVIESTVPRLPKCIKLEGSDSRAPEKESGGPGSNLSLVHHYFSHPVQLSKIFLKTKLQNEESKGKWRVNEEGVEMC